MFKYNLSTTNRLVTFAGALHRQVLWHPSGLLEVAKGLESVQVLHLLYRLGWFVLQNSLDIPQVGHSPPATKRMQNDCDNLGIGELV